MDLFEAVLENNVVKVMGLLERGVDPNQLDLDQHYNALHYAVQSNAIDVVMLLVTAGADMEAITEDNLTVFDIAREYQDKEMMRLLLKLSHMRLSRSRSAHQ
jgi:ankyrin repeat protein